MGLDWISVEERPPEGSVILGLLKDDPRYPMDWDDRVAVISGYDIDQRAPLLSHWIPLEPPA